MTWAKRIACLAAVAAVLSNCQVASSQNFINLNFEQAGVPQGTQVDDPIPFSTAFPGWTGYEISQLGGPTNEVTAAIYDGLSIGGVTISLIDSNSGVSPLSGRYSVALFGGAGIGGSGLYTAAISQTGLVPQGTRTLLIDVHKFGSVQGSTFNISLDGQTINMVPVETFANYTEYGGDITSFANQMATLAISVPSPLPPIVPPYAYSFDDIVFSTTPLPEPGTTALWVLGLGLPGALRAWKMRRGM